MSTPTSGHKKIRTIVITGGPCGGKTTAMSWLQNALTSAGYAVIFLTETFTELANGGISSYNCKDNFAFQRIQVRYQLERERLYRRAAEALANDNVVIVHDRGSMDDKPYMEPEEFAAILKELDQDEVSFRDKYDAVFHLVTAAKGALPFYTTANNTARTETPEEAIDLDEKTLAAWAGHPHLRIIDNSTDFNGKMLRLLKEVMTSTGSTTTPTASGWRSSRPTSPPTGTRSAASACGAPAAATSTTRPPSGTPPTAGAWRWRSA